MIPIDDTYNYLIVFDDSDISQSILLISVNELCHFLYQYGKWGWGGITVLQTDILSCGDLLGVVNYECAFNILLSEGSLHIILHIFSVLFNPFQNKPLFLRVCSQSLLKTLQYKEKLLLTSNFSFPTVFTSLFGEISVIFIKSKIVICKLFQFGRI